MKLKNLLFITLIGIFTFTSCDDDDHHNNPVDETVVDFGTAPSFELIASGSVEVITENTVRYHVFNFTNDPYTVTVVETESNFVIVDLGPAPTFATELRAYVDVINKPGNVIITHNHGDHYGGAGSFTDYDFYAESTVASQLNSSESFTELYTNGVIPVSTRKMIGELVFTFDKVSNAETGENGYIYNELHKILFVGDLVYNQTHPYLREYTPAGEDEIDNWIAGLNTIKSEFSNYNYLFVGHNKYRTDIATVIDENITYLQDAQGLIKGSKTLTAGGVASTQQEVIDELQVLYPDYLVGGLLLSLPDAFFTGDPGASWFLGGGLTSIAIEVTSFNLKEGVDMDTFQTRDAQIEQDFASQQPGFLKRMSGLDVESGKYVIMVFWETIADANNSIEAFGNDASVSDYFEMINGETFKADKYTSLSFPNINFSLAENNVIEVTTFNINSDVDATAFKARDGRIDQEYASKQPGYIRRTSGLHESESGRYAVIAFWQTDADAEASINAFGSDETVADYFAMINGSTFGAERFTVFN